MKPHPLPRLAFVSGILLFTLNLGLLGWLFACERANAFFAANNRKILAIKPKLSDLESKIWGIISVYAPTKGKKVDFSEVPYKTIMEQITGFVLEAKASQTGKASALKLRVIEKSLRALSRTIELVSDDLHVQAETALYFSESAKAAGVKKAYTDQMTKTMEQIRFGIRVVSMHIDAYYESEIAGWLDSTQRAARWGKALLLAGLCLNLVAFALFLGSARKIPRADERE